LAAPFGWWAVWSQSIIQPRLHPFLFVLCGNSGNNLHLTEKELEEKSEPEGEPDWGDAFSESGDEMDEDAKEGYDAEVKKG